jgi:hypothetical protein
MRRQCGVSLVSGRAKFLYSMSRIVPNGIFTMINRAAEKRALVT